ncbi:MAG: hypothetical protein FWD69_00385 [Polyangiaceae bacterium]|nr:hypothetical protein [Polyangiaceae bacterium]
MKRMKAMMMFVGVAAAATVATVGSAMPSATLGANDAKDGGQDSGGNIVLCGDDAGYTELADKDAGKDAGYTELADKDAGKDAGYTELADKDAGKDAGYTELADKDAGKDAGRAEF